MQAVGLDPTKGHPAWWHCPHGEQKPACLCLEGDVTPSLEVAGETAVISALLSFVPSKDLWGRSGPGGFASPTGSPPCEQKSRAVVQLQSLTLPSGSLEDGQGTAGGGLVCPWKPVDGCPVS